MTVFFSPTVPAAASYGYRSTLESFETKSEAPSGVSAIPWFSFHRGSSQRYMLLLR